MQMNQNGFGQPMQMQGRPLTVMLVPDINNIDGYSINPGASMLFLNESMTEFRMRSRDTNGFLGQERKWTLKEVTPPPQVPQGQFATREEFNSLNGKIDEMMKILGEFTK